MRTTQDVIELVNESRIPADYYRETLSQILACALTIARDSQLDETDRFGILCDAIHDAIGEHVL